MSQDELTIHSTFLRRKHYAALLFIFITIAVYGSWVPFHFVAISWEEACQRFSKVPFLNLGIHSRSDFVANILLFIPLGCFGMGWFCVDRKKTNATVLISAIWLAFLVGLSVAIEFSQQYFPGRSVNQNDILAESMGAVIGIVIWWTVGQTCTNWARQLWSHWDQENSVAQLLPGYLAFLILIHVMPLDLTLSPVEIYHKYKEGRIHGVPFASTIGWDFARKFFMQMVYYAPLGIILAKLPNKYQKWVGHWVKVLFIGMGIAGMNEFLQLFVFSRTSDSTDIITGGLSVLFGWALCQALTERVRGCFSNLTFKWGLLVVWMAVMVIVQWQPFRFNWDWDFVSHRLQTMSLIPFADYHSGSDYNAFDQFLHKVLLYLPLGILLHAAWGLNRWQVILIAVSMAVLGEIGQLALPGRFAGVSDVMVQSLGAWLGWEVANRMRVLVDPESGKDAWNSEPLPSCRASSC